MKSPTQERRRRVGDSAAVLKLVKVEKSGAMQGVDIVLIQVQTNRHEPARLPPAIAS